MDSPTSDDWNWRPKWLVLSGGGARWVAHIGALMFLDYNQYLNNIKGISATSAGSLIAALWCLGYTPEDMLLIVESLDHEKIVPTTEIPKFFLRGYLADGNYHRKVLSEILFEGPNKSRKGIWSETTTLEELYSKCNIDLHIWAICEETRQARDFNHVTDPQKLLLEVVMASMAIPWVIKPVQIDNTHFIDGGLLNNYPVNVFPLAESLCIRLGIREKEKLDLKIFKDAQFADGSFKDIYHTLFESITRAGNMFSMMIDEIERLHIIKNGNWIKEIVVDTKNVSTMSFECTDQDRKMLIEQGIRATFAFISNPVAKKFSQ